MTFNFIVSVGIILANKLVRALSFSSYLLFFKLVCFSNFTGSIRFFVGNIFHLILIILFNNLMLKLHFCFQVMGRVGFKFPIFLTLIHYVTSWLLLAIFKTLSILPVAPPSRTTPFSSIFSLGAVMAIASGLANTSLKHNRSFLASFLLSCMLTCYKRTLFGFLTVLLVAVLASTRWLKLLSLLPLFLLSSFSSGKPFLLTR